MQRNKSRKAIHKIFVYTQHFVYPILYIMKHFVKTSSLILSIVFLITLCSCSLFVYDNSRFEGGETLNNDLLSKIENDLRNESQAEESESTEDNQSDLPVESDSEANTDNSTTVYWTGSGSVWHTRRDCSYIKNSDDIFSGTVSEAISKGKKKLCSSCQKH